MTESFTELLRAPNEDVWADLLNNGFVAGMADATLPPECFRYYIEQNLIYLPCYARVLGLGAARSTTLPELERFSGSLQQIVGVEIGANRQLRDRVIDLGAPDRGGDREASPACLAYTSFLLATAATGDAFDIVAATLPCAWSYHEIAIQYPDPAPHPVYREWLSFFASDEYATYLKGLLAQVDDIGKEIGAGDRSRLQQHFRTGARLERGFWEMGLTMQRWPDATDGADQ